MTEKIARLDYTNKQTWVADNLPKIAGDLGYVADERFAAAFAQFVAQTVDPTKLTTYLFTLAERTFREVKPPLERVAKK